MYLLASFFRTFSDEAFLLVKRDYGFFIGSLSKNLHFDWLACKVILLRIFWIYKYVLHTHI